jgi:hypothetical protein
MHTDPISTVALTAGGAFVGKFVGPAAESLGKAAWEQVCIKTTAMLAAVGRAPQPVEPKILLPLVQAACLETDETLTKKWAALLANAADPIQRMAVPPSYIEVLRQLTSTDALVMEALYAKAGAAFDANQPSNVATSELQQQLGLGNVAIALSVENLLRLRLCKGVPTYGDGDTAQNLAVPLNLLMTFFGWQFRAACLAPAT